MMKNILFVLAHMDDEVYQMGTILRYLENGHNVYLLTIHGKGRLLDKNHNSRITQFKKVCQETFTDYDKLTFLDIDSYFEINSKGNKILKDKIEECISKWNICTVYTHFKYDLHLDHQMVSNAVRLVVRPDRSDIRELYECYIPGSTERGSNFNISEWTEVTEIKHILEKMKLVQGYGEELRGSNSHYGILNGSKYFGSMFGFEHAEIFKCIFKKN